MGFKPGESGNPKGRPKGIKDARHRYRAQLEAAAPELVQKTIDLALEGDTVALRIAMDKIIPNIRPSAQAVIFQANSDSLTAKANAIMDAASQGQVPPDIAATLINALASTIKIAETEQFSKRLATLEEAAGIPVSDEFL